jgi:hypothetical protein
MGLANFLRAASLGVALFANALQAFAGSADYSFETAHPAVKTGEAIELAVRLIHKPSGKPVAGAILFRTRLDMSPDDMVAMTGKHLATATSEPGVYRFKADLTMAGGWALKIMAKVPGEADTVHGTVVFQAKD